MTYSPYSYLKYEVMRQELYSLEKDYPEQISIVTG